ncbi:hypothetical protein [Clostridium sp.]|uniref:hypothetical protein n=1 Tax=Clostridium sp. TaxID=1506 RepID=UPI00262457FC|nr:hypothetical protein [Clostridium sp.]
MPKRNSKYKDNKSMKRIKDFILQPQKVKMSEVLLEFSKPVIDEYENVDEVKKIIHIAVLVWNLSFLDEKEQVERKEDIYKVFAYDKALLKNIVLIIDILLIRKKEYFSNINLMIESHEVVVVNGEMRIRVGSREVI